MNIQAILDGLQPVFGLFGNHPTLKVLAVMLASLALAKLVALLMVKVIGRLTRRTGNLIDDALLAILHKPLFWSVLMVGLLLSLQILQLQASVASTGRSIVYSILIFIWAQFAIRSQRIVTKAMSENAGQNAIVRPQTLPLFDNISLIGIGAFSIYFVLQAWRIDMTAWIASAGIAGIAIGFAAKDTLANLFSGVFILADAPYKIADYIVLESGERGKVTHIGIRSTRLLTRDDVEVTVPNSIMGNSRIVNESGGRHLKYRIRVDVGVAYGSDIDEVRRILTEIATEEEEACTDPEPRVRFRSFGASSLDFQLQVWVSNPEIRGRVLDSLNTRIYKRFMAESIEIPYSKHDLYIKEMPTQAPKV